MATLSARPASRLRSTRTLALYHSGLSIMRESPLGNRFGTAELSCSGFVSTDHGPLDNDRLGLRVVVDGLYAVLLAVARLLPAAEGQLVVDELGGVDPGVARLESLGGLGGPVEVGGPDRGAEPVDRTVREFERLLHARDAPDREGRPEDFLRGHPRITRRLEKQGRLVEETIIQAVTLWPLRPVEHLGPRVHGVFDLLLEKIPLPRGVQRPEHHPLCGAWPDPQLSDLARELLDELVGHVLEDVEALDGEARLAAVEEAAHAGGARGLAQVGIVADDHGVRAPELERGALEVARRERHELLAGRRGSCEGYLAYEGVPRERLPGTRARSRDDVEHACRQACPVHDPGDPECGERGGICGFGHHHVARYEGRTELVTQQGGREVPRHDGPDDAKGTPDYEAVGVLVEVRDVSAPNVLGEPHVVLQRVHEAPDLQARLAQRLPLLGGQKRGELPHGGQHGLRRRAEDLSTLRRRGIAPGREGFGGAPDRPIHRLRVGGRYGIHLLPVRGIEDGHEIQARKVDVAALDERLRHRDLLLRTFWPAPGGRVPCGRSARYQSNQLRKPLSTERSVKARPRCCK